MTGKAPTPRLCRHKDQPTVTQFRHTMAAGLVSSCAQFERVSLSDAQREAATRKVVASLWPEVFPCIVSAAIRLHDGSFCTMEPVRGHAEIVMALNAIGITGVARGFLTSDNRYVDRAEAFRIAFKADQPIVQKFGPNQDLLLDGIL